MVWVIPLNFSDNGVDCITGTGGFIVVVVVAAAVCSRIQCTN